MSEAERLALAAGCQITTVEGRELSPRNQLLVMLQLQGRAVTLVGGFRQWLAAGRCVRKGERGASIWIPTGKGDSGDAGAAPGGEREPTGEELDKLRFVTGTVFDISQTEPASDHAAAAPITNERGELLLEGV